MKKTRRLAKTKQDVFKPEEAMEVNTLYLANALEHKDIVNKLMIVSDTVKKIEVQTRETNGRVGTLEKVKWVAYGVFVILIPVLYFLANTVLSNTGVIRKFEQLHSKELVTTPNSEPVR